MNIGVFMVFFVLGLLLGTLLPWFAPWFRPPRRQARTPAISRNGTLWKLDQDCPITPP